MHARDLKTQLTFVDVDLYETAHVYRQAFFVWHPYIDLRLAIFPVTLYVGEIMLSYAHNHFAVLVAATGELDTVVSVKAKR